MIPGVLYARRDSVYKSLRADVYDEDRDARTWHRCAPVVAHPPCRGWGRLRKFAKVAAHELELGRHAVACVRRCGGVLEHPESSALWSDMGLPRPGQPKDEHGGWTFPVSQSWFGHRAEKRTWLYIVGVDPGSIPDFPLVLGEAPCVIARSARPDGSRRVKGDRDWRPEVSKSEREATPIQFAEWLLELARTAA